MYYKRRHGPVSGDHAGRGSRENCAHGRIIWLAQRGKKLHSQAYTECVISFGIISFSISQFLLKTFNMFQEVTSRARLLSNVLHSFIDSTECNDDIYSKLHLSFFSLNLGCEEEARYEADSDICYARRCQVLTVFL